MTYTALSRARSIRQIGIDGVNEARFTTQIANNAGLKRRVVEQKRLAQLAEETMLRWPLPPDDESVDGGGDDGGDGGGGGGPGNDEYQDEDTSVVSIDESGASESDAAESDAAESDDGDVVFVEAQPQQPPNVVVPVNMANNNEMDESYYDVSIYYQPNGKRRRGGARLELLRRQRAGGAGRA